MPPKAVTQYNTNSEIKIMSRASEILERIDTLLEREVKRVVRGKKVIKKVLCKPGYKAVDGRCVPMDSKEKRARKVGAKIGARKKKSQSAKINRNRALSMRKRKSSLG